MRQRNPIHLLHRDPRRCAAMHADRDVVDGVVAAAALLGTAHALCGEAQLVQTLDGYDLGWCLTRPPHRGVRLYPVRTVDDDPSSWAWAQWTAASPGNYHWMRGLFVGFLEEYQRRYGDAKGHRHRTWEMRAPLWNPPASSVANAEANGQPEAMTPWPDRLVGFAGLKDPVARGRYAYRNEHPDRSDTEWARCPEGPPRELRF